MSYHFLQGPEAASWLPNCSDGLPSALARLSPTLEAFYSNGNATGPSTDSQYGTTCKPSTVPRGAVQLTLFPGASPAKTLARRVKVRDSPAAVRASFGKCCESLERYGLVLSSPKTLRTFVPMALAPLSRDLGRWGTTALGACWGLGTRAAPIKGTGFGLLLPTPTCQGNEHCPSMLKWAGHRRLAEYLEKWGLLPTPAATVWKSNKGGAGGRVGRERPSIDTLTRGPSPQLREWMMAWPIGWTALEPLETGKFRSWRLLHSTFFRGR